MSAKFAARARKIAYVFILTSIIGISFMSLLPWISVKEYAASTETITVFYDKAMIEKSTSEQIYSLAKPLDHISMYLWVTLACGIISLVGVTIYISKKLALYDPNHLHIT